MTAPLDRSSPLFQYVHPPAFFVFEQQRRFDDLNATSTQLRVLSRKFRGVQDHASKLSKLLREALDLLTSLEMVCTDATVRPLLPLLSGCANSYHQHFIALSETVIGPLEAFTNRELESLESYAKGFDRNQATLLSVEEKYVALPAAQQRPDKFPALPQSHADATTSFFQFAAHMQFLEFRLKCLGPQIVLFFSNASV
jgi:hypothetical protein